MNKLTVNQLLHLNRKVLGDDTVCFDAVRVGVVTDIAEWPYRRNEKGLYVYKSTVEKAAALGCAIATRRPFERGNSETAVLAALTLLEVNKSKLRPYAADLALFTRCLWDGDYEGGCAWLRAHTEEKYTQV